MAEHDEVQVTHASLHRGDIGTVIGPASQAGMDVVVDFGNGDRAEYRRWELTTIDSKRGAPGG